MPDPHGALPGRSLQPSGRSPQTPAEVCSSRGSGAGPEIVAARLQGWPGVGKPADVDLEIAEDPRLQGVTWAAERVFFVVMALTILAALLGALGSGPLSRATGGPPAGPLRVDYAWVLPSHAPERLRIHLTAGAVPDGLVRLWIDRAWLEGVHVEQVMPVPERAEAEREGVVYVVRIASPDRPATLVLHYQAETFGRRTGRLGLEGARPVTFTQWVLP